MSRRRLVILGATGSIGLNAVDVVKTHPDRFEVVAVAALRSREKCEALARELGAKAYVGEDAALRAVEENDADVCLVATVGLSGLRPTLAAIEKGMDIALATKEVMVMAGELVTRLAREKGVRFLPVDSEHSAIFQCLQSVDAKSVRVPVDAKSVRVPVGAKSVRVPRRREICSRREEEDFVLIERGKDSASTGRGKDSASTGRGKDSASTGRGKDSASTTDVDRLILTASGGPFLDAPADLSTVTVAEALNHPRWKMGPKVTVDSSTMMNKGFEILEARWLFDVPVEQIDVVVHPESIVHSLVTFTDGATLAQLSPPDMRVAIQYALTWPERLPSPRARLDLAALGALTFRAPDPNRFPCLRLVKEALNRGGCATAVLAAADEWAVQAFLDGKIGYTAIADTVARCLDAAPEMPCDSLEAVLAADAWVRRHLNVV